MLKPNSIRHWMNRNSSRFIDPLTNELNCTAIVEAWDSECSTGEETIDPSHPAWEIATGMFYAQ